MKKVKKGERERPCPRCSTPVRYLKGKSAVNVRSGRQRQGWHWVNGNGSHHRCGDFVEVSQEMNRRAGSFHEGTLAAQWKAAMERDSYRTGQGMER